MEVSTISDHGEQHEQHKCRHHLEQQLISFKYLKDDTSTVEVRIRNTMATALMARLSMLWTKSSNSFPRSTGSTNPSQSPS
ncbi:hypothetical protein DPMN_122100 [Dreissena polymorpha]|uniref:Uncharacterized protein n=1 Tax=Dreissena polymorpha TaxID=45954 RepID=A0A9D4JRN9_DREPO|nr:hypothetical protein DPMN_122100 [Dreissena polymorpha]